MPLLKKYRVNGMMHITGGAFTKLKGILGKADAVIAQPSELRPQKIFWDLYAKGVPNKTMYSTFNCGIGFVLSVPQSNAKQIVSKIENAGIIGRVTLGTGLVHIKSAFDGKNIVL